MRWPRVKATKTDHNNRDDHNKNNDNDTATINTNTNTNTITNTITNNRIIIDNTNTNTDDNNRIIIDYTPVDSRWICASSKLAKPLSRACVKHSNNSPLVVHTLRSGKTLDPASRYFTFFEAVASRVPSKFNAKHTIAFSWATIDVGARDVSPRSYRRTVPSVGPGIANNGFDVLGLSAHNPANARSSDRRRPLLPFTAHCTFLIRTCVIRAQAAGFQCKCVDVHFVVENHNDPVEHSHTTSAYTHPSTTHTDLGAA